MNNTSPPADAQARQPNIISACRNENCPLRMRCRRFTGPNTAGRTCFTPRTKGAHWVCPQYWYNGQTAIEPPL